MQFRQSQGKKNFGIICHKDDFKGSGSLECGNYRINLDSVFTHGVLTFIMQLFKLEQTGFT